MHTAQRIGLVLALSLIGLVGCDGDSTITTGTVHVVGSGLVVEEDRAASGFRHVTFATEGALQIEQGVREELLVRAEQNLLPHLRTEVQGDVLVMRTANGVDLMPTRPIQFFLTVVDLERVVMSGVGGIEATSLSGDHIALVTSGVGSIECFDVDAADLDVTVSGVGGATTAGQVDEQTVVLSGIGEYDGRELASREAVVTVTSMGSATVRVSERLVATISGGGSIYYIGDPIVESTITGSGRIQKIG